MQFYTCIYQLYTPTSALSFAAMETGTANCERQGGSTVVGGIPPPRPSISPSCVQGNVLVLDPRERSYALNRSRIHYIPDNASQRKRGNKSDEVDKY